jgi:hypothetical protein
VASIPDQITVIHHLQLLDFIYLSLEVYTIHPFKAYSKALFGEFQVPFKVSFVLILCIMLLSISGHFYFLHKVVFIQKVVFLQKGVFLQKLVFHQKVVFLQRVVFRQKMVFHQKVAFLHKEVFRQKVALLHKVAFLPKAAFVHKVFHQNVAFLHMEVFRQNMAFLHMEVFRQNMAFLHMEVFSIIDFFPQTEAFFKIVVFHQKVVLLQIKVRKEVFHLQTTFFIHSIFFQLVYSQGILVVPLQLAQTDSISFLDLIYLNLVVVRIGCQFDFKVSHKGRKIMFEPLEVHCCLVEIHVTIYFSSHSLLINEYRFKRIFKMPLVAKLEI